MKHPVMIVQYRMADPSKALFRLREPDKVLHDAAEVALRGVVGRTTIDEVLTTGREAAQTDTRKHLQELMDQWNGIPDAEAAFGVATAGGPYNGATDGSTFGTFTNSRFEVAWDDTGEILAHFGIGGGVLGITLKSVDADAGSILDLLIVVNTRPGALLAPGSGATAEQLFRSTLLHELGHALGLSRASRGGGRFGGAAAGLRTARCLRRGRSDRSLFSRSAKAGTEASRLDLMSPELLPSFERFAANLHRARRRLEKTVQPRAAVLGELFDVAADFVTPGDLQKSRCLAFCGKLKTKE